MRKEIFILPILILALGIILAVSTPEAFNGNIIVKDGKIAEGKLLVGYVNGVATGSVLISNGQFDIVVQDNVGNGGEIEFYIGNEKAKETFNFDSFKVITKDLNFDTISEEEGDVNGICDIENECSTNNVDCGINQCNSNGRCDIEIGENCANAPIDCGICPVQEEPTSSSDSPSISSSSSSSGGGGGGIITTKNTSSNATINSGDATGLSSDISGLTTDELNKKEMENNEKGFFRLTGNAISSFSKTSTGKGIFITLLIVVVLSLAYFGKKRFSRKE
jgi:hypothetical protein